MAQMVEHFPKQPQALSLNPRISAPPKEFQWQNSLKKEEN
jgi:hypothetical protein